MDPSERIGFAREKKHCTLSFGLHIRLGCEEILDFLHSQTRTVNTELLSAVIRSHSIPGQDVAQHSGPCRNRNLHTTEYTNKTLKTLDDPVGVTVTFGNTKTGCFKRCVKISK